MAELHDLQTRLAKAAIELDEIADASSYSVEHERLRGKAQGVRLALSYVDEMVRNER